MTWEKVYNEGYLTLGEHLKLIQMNLLVILVTLVVGSICFWLKGKSEKYRLSNSLENLSILSFVVAIIMSVISLWSISENVDNPYSNHARTWTEQDVIPYLQHLPDETYQVKQVLGEGAAQVDFASLFPASEQGNVVKVQMLYTGTDNIAKAYEGYARIIYKNGAVPTVSFKRLQRDLPYGIAKGLYMARVTLPYGFQVQSLPNN